MLPFPARASDPVVLADWLEVNALADNNRQVSLDVLVTAALSSSVFHGDRSDFETTEYDLTDMDRTHEVFHGRSNFETTEYLLAEVVDELRFRENYSSYPFNLIGSSLEYRHGYDVMKSTYMFCLALSVLPWRTPKMSNCFPERIFEEISTLAAKRYLGGDAVRFASPRKSAVPAKFEKAIDYLIRKMREETSLKNDHITGNEKDAKVDVVAWKLLDDRPGKVMIMGSCATGDHWRDKLGEVNPDSFCRTYFSDPPVPAPLKAFFTSSIVPRDRWTPYTYDAGILFDRFRIADLVPNIPAMKTHGDGEVWLKRALDTHA